MIWPRFFGLLVSVRLIVIGDTVCWIKLVIAVLFAVGVPLIEAQVDPGPRGGTASAGGAVSGLSPKQTKFFNDGQGRFGEVETIAKGLGPRFNLTSCSGCHAQPAPGGSSPASNPEVSVGVAPAAQVSALINLGLISATGPVREVRFKSDSGVHDLFTIAGIDGAPAGCTIAQPNFGANLSNMSFRIPTPVFGAGMIEAIPEAAILANVSSTKPFGITGHASRSPNDGTINRFGWKAQSKSLASFSGEAYNVEMGISNELFPDERGEAGVPDPAVCLATSSPNDYTNYEFSDPVTVPSDVIAFANFMRFLAPPTPSCILGVTCSASVNRGSVLFDNTGCAVCHVRSMPTGSFSVAALRNQPVGLFSDLLVHNMGLLSDGITQGNAGPSDFRTAPLWGLGQRLFFLHDGRTSDLLSAIEDHAAGGMDATSEANRVIQNFNALTQAQKQDILNFLRTL